MGTYDTLICLMPLPGNPPENAGQICFQTKNFDCTFDTYTIRADGALLSHDGTPMASLTGQAVFYTSNVVASGPGVYTANGEDARWLEYRATFKMGRVESIEVVEDKSEPAAKRRFSKPTPLSDEELALIKTRREENLLGRRMYLRYGGGDKGREVTVVHANKRYLLLEDADEGIDKLDRHMRDRLLFDTAADAEAYNAERATEWQAEKDAFDAEIKAKKEQPSHA